MYRAFLLLLVAFSLTTTVFAHSSHVSVAQADWNAKSQKLEVALRVHAIDLERVIRVRTGKNLNLDDTKDVEKAVIAYLTENFIVGREFEKPKSGRSQKVLKPQKMEWVGMEVEIKYAWLYFEVPLKEGIEGTRFSNTMFFEHLTNQANTINLKHGKQRTSVVSTKGKPLHTATFRLSKK